MPNILIVDDDVTITELLKALVRMDGHTATTVNDSTRAFELARTVRPDLITLDLMMPGITGFELCEQLHQDPQFARTPILIVSARDDPESRERAMKAGAADYVIKPFGADDFLQKVRELTGS